MYCVIDGYEEVFTGSGEVIWAAPRGLTGFEAYVVDGTGAIQPFALIFPGTTTVVKYASAATFTPSALPNGYACNEAVNWKFKGAENNTLVVSFSYDTGSTP